VCLRLLAPGACLSRLAARERKPRDIGNLSKLGAGGADARLAGCSRGRRREQAALEKCVPCTLRGKRAPKLWLKETSDGFGSRMHNILAAMAFAAKHQMNFGGVVAYNECNENHFDNGHGEDILRLVSGVLGLSDPNDLFTDFEPDPAETVTNVDNLLANLELGAYGDGMNVILPQYSMAVDLNAHGRHVADYFNPTFLAAVRSQDTPLARVPLQFQPGRPSVVLHVRRGDLFLEGNGSQRITPDEWYFRILDHVEARFGEARPDVHVFTSLSGKPVKVRGPGHYGPNGGWKNGAWKNTYPAVHNTSEFEAYARRGMTLHYDGDPLEAWAHFVHADVLLTAKSEFSYVPAMLSERCVVYQHFWLDPLPDWIHASDGNWLRRTKKTPEFWFDEAKLDSCIDGVKARLKI